MIDARIPRKQSGFTLIELLVVISIIGVLSTIAMTSLNGARAKARDTRRLVDIEQIRNALEIYRETYGHYPYNTDDDTPQHWGGDSGYSLGENSGDTFIQPLVDAGLFSKTPGDPTNKAQVGGYWYYLYPAGVWGNCDPALGDVYVLDVTFETSSYNAKKPGFKCSAGSNGTTSWGGLDWTGWGWIKAQNG